MALAVGTYDPPAGIAGELRKQLDAQLGVPPASAQAQAEKFVLALSTAWFNVLTGASVYPTANASTSTPNAAGGAATLAGSVV